MAKNVEHDRFTNLMSKLIKVPHAEVKAKLDAERKAKERKKSKRSSASREAV